MYLVTTQGQYSSQSVTASQVKAKLGNSIDIDQHWYKEDCQLITCKGVVIGYLFNSQQAQVEYLKLIGVLG